MKKTTIIIIALAVISAFLLGVTLRYHQKLSQQEQKKPPILYYDQKALELLEAVYIQAGKETDTSPAAVARTKSKSDILQRYIEKHNKEISRGILLYIQDNITDLEGEASINLNFWILPYKTWSEPLFDFDHVTGGATIEDTIRNAWNNPDVRDWYNGYYTIFENIDNGYSGNQREMDSIVNLFRNYYKNI
jgi:hypothetical protein